MDYREGKKLADEAREVSLKLLAKEKLSKEDQAQMLTAAQACVFIWSRAGTPLQVARSHWLVSRSFCRLEEARMALLHAQLCDFYTKNSGDRKDFDEAFAAEALARVAALKGDIENGRRLRQEALNLGEKIRDPNDRRYFEEQFSALSWFHLEVSP